MSKLYENILPLINYSLSAQIFPHSTESREVLPLENSLDATSYSDFTSSIYDIPTPCEVVNKKPYYAVPSEMNFAKDYIDWKLLQQGAERKDFRAKTGQIDRILMLHFDLELPLVPKFMDMDYWLNNVIIIPTHYVDIKTEKFMCFKFQSLVLIKYSVTISVDKVNQIQCSVFGYNPDIIFLDKLPTDYSLFENWISQSVEIHTYPNDIGLTFDKSVASNSAVFSLSASCNSNVSLVTYKDSTELKDVWYIYVPDNKGKFTRTHGFVTLSEYPVKFNTYNWILIQSQPSFDVDVVAYDPKHKLSQSLATKLQIHFKNQNDLLGSIYVYVTDASFDMYRVQISGFGRYEPGDL